VGHCYTWAERRSRPEDLDLRGLEFNGRPLVRPLPMSGSESLLRQLPVHPMHAPTSLTGEAQGFEVQCAIESILYCDQPIQDGTDGWNEVHLVGQYQESRSPTVPRMGICSAVAHRRAARSSMTPS